MVDGAQGERIARLEQRVDDVSTRVGNLDSKVTALGAIGETVGVLAERVANLQRDFSEFVTKFTTEIDSRDQRDVANKKDRRDIRIALWTFTVMIICALIGAATIVLTSGK